MRLQTGAAEAAVARLAHHMVARVRLQRIDDPPVPAVVDKELAAELGALPIIRMPSSL